MHLNNVVCSLSKTGVSTRYRSRTLCPMYCDPATKRYTFAATANDSGDAKNSRWRIGGVKVVDPQPIENYEALRSRGSYSPGLDPIISCPLSGSACYAIGLRGPNRRAVCFVSLIAERLSGGPPRLHLPSQRSPFAFSPSLLPLGPRGPLASSSSCDVGRRGRHFIFKKQSPSALSFVRLFSVQPRGSILFCV